jgi:hypothetical protein
MQMAWRDVAMAMDRRTKSPDVVVAFSVLSQGQRDSSSQFSQINGLELELNLTTSRIRLTVLILTNSRSPHGPSSRPYPDCLTPPNGIARIGSHHSVDEHGAGLDAVGQVLSLD